MSMKDDIKLYPIYIFKNTQLKRVFEISDTSNYNHYTHELHHFVPKSIRKINKERYTRLEHLQKLILVSKQEHLDIHNMSDDRFYKKYGIERKELLYSRKR